MKHLMAAILVVLFASACATTSARQTQPQPNPKIANVKSIVLIPLQVDLYKISTGGVQEKIDDWSLRAKNNLLSAIEEELKAKPLLFVKSFHETLLSESKRANLAETSALFDAVSTSIVLHVYGPAQHRFEEKITHFDYTLGAEVSELAEGSDALLFVQGSDQITSAGRKALQTGAVILGALIGAVMVPQAGVTSVRVALVDGKSGELLWFNHHSSAGDHDLRDPLNTHSLVKQLFEEFPN